MIIVDFQATMIACLMAGIKGDRDITLTEDLLRHMILNSLRTIRMKYKSYGEMVLASDGRDLWRKKVYPYYKAKRAKTRDDSPLDWKLVYTTFDKIKAEIEIAMPYRVIHDERAEADDVIATLVTAAKEPVVIISGDHDFVQLHGPSVKQWDHARKREIAVLNPAAHLKTKIIKGDTGDGVPNFLSADDVFVTGTRQKSVFEKKLQVWLDQEPEQFCENAEQLANYRRNEQLVDLSKIPDEIRESILDKYGTGVKKDRSKIMEYFVAYRLRNLMADIQDF